MSAFTIEEAKELKLPLALLNQWNFVMTVLWNFFVAYSKKESNVKIQNPPNEILFQLGEGHKFRIVVEFYNSKYLSLHITIDGNEEFEAVINNIDYFGAKGIIKTVSEILTHAENVK